MNYFGAVAALGAGMSAWAADTGQAHKRVVPVCLIPDGNPTVLFRGRATANRIFEQAGIRLAWRTDARSCLASGSNIVVIVSLKVSEDQGALAYAMPFQGNRIVLNYHRLSTVEPALLPFVLGTALAHEICHILRGDDRHSTSGVMKARWDGADFANMQRGRLKFTEEDIQMIHSGLDWRASRAAWR
jgi:hypothetical protein